MKCKQTSANFLDRWNLAQKLVTFRLAEYLTTFIRHPGMAGSTNDCERFIRKYIVRTRNIQRILCNRKAAETFAVLQTFHATCKKLGKHSGDVIIKDDEFFNLFESAILPPIFANM